MSQLIACIFLLAFFGCAQKQSVSNTIVTEVKVVEITDLNFKADSFFEERINLSFHEAEVDPIFQIWAEEAIINVNELLPSDAILPQVKIKLIFQAKIESSNGKVILTPISIIDSYQEPKTKSIRLGMTELKNDKLSFQLTVAHEYAHLVFENASRVSGKTPSTAENFDFWSKSIYEGTADLVMALALNSDLTAASNNWSSRNINEFTNIADARKSKDETYQRAHSAFKKMGLIPKYEIYNEWLKKVKKYIASIGGIDPYAEGRWLAGSINKIAVTQSDKKKIVSLLVAKAQSGKPENDIEKLYVELINHLEN